MNPIDQLMQSFGGTPSTAVAGLLGISPASNAAEGGASDLFANTLQGIQATAEASDVAPEGLLSAEFIAPTDLTAFGMTMPEQMGDTFNLKAFLGLPNDAPASAVFAQLGQEISLSDGVSGVQPATPQAAAAADIIKGAQSHATAETGGLPMLPAARLEQLGLKLEQLPALPSGIEIAEVSAAGIATSSHMLPANIVAASDSIEATTDPNAGQATDPNVQQGVALSVTQAQIGTAPEVTAEAQANQTSAVQSSSNQSAAPTDAAGDQDTSIRPSSADGVPSLTAPAATPEGVDPTAGKQTAEPQGTGLSPVASAAGAATAQAAAQLQQAEAEARAPSEQQPDGNVVATTQQATAPQQQAVQQANAGKKTTPAATTTGKHANAGNQSTAPTNMAAAADAPKDSGSAKPVEPVSARSDAPPPPQVMREPAHPLTPERLSGFMDSTAASTVASGLAGMKGESSFLASMSLLGGKASPEFAQQVGQQLNMQVTKAINAGNKEFTVRLDPAELGRLQVKLSFGKDGSVQTRVLVERPETLELLQKDAKSLERAITAAGHKADGGIQFSLDTNDQQSAGRAFAEAVQQEKMRDELAARSGMNGETGADEAFDEEEIVPLDEILANVSVETGLDISV